MNFVKHYRCTLCDATYPPTEINTCSECGEKGILDIEYDYEAMKTMIHKPYFDSNHQYDMWRYAPMMSVETQHLYKSLRVGWTPLYEAQMTHKTLGLKKVYIKDEGVNPTGSLKDRASAVAVIKAITYGYDTISCSSTGNAASSLAGNAARMGLKTVIFVPKRAPSGKLRQLMMYGARVISVDGDYRDTYNLSKAAIDEFNWYNRNAAINPHLVEGKKTVALEIAEQLQFQPTDWVVVSVGDGCTIAGVYKGFYDLKMLGLIAKIPKLLGVQSAGCDPFVQAAKASRDLEEVEENTIADSIAVGLPRNPVKGLAAVKKSQGQWINVSDEHILASMKTLGKTEGIFGEPAGVTAYAGLEKAVKEGIITASETATIIVTGNGLKDPENAEKVTGKPVRLKPDLEALKKYLKQQESEDKDE